MSKGIKGYKVFNSDWTCIGFQYSCPGVFEISEEPIVCERGFHFCLNLADCFKYYSFNPNNKIAKVVALGDIDYYNSCDDKVNADTWGTTKCCTNKIMIVEELSWKKASKKANINKNCCGVNNCGKNNIGNHNSSSYNLGDSNTSSFNHGDYNSGYDNFGCANSGSRNFGCHNSGSYNIGDSNSGDFNKTDYSSGCFMTCEQPFYMFNKPTEWSIEQWRESGAFEILSEMPSLHNLTWVDTSALNCKERSSHPECKISGGYPLDVGDPHFKENHPNFWKKNKEYFDSQYWWDTLPECDKNEVLNLPNFDAEIFKEITGIDIYQQE